VEAFDRQRGEGEQPLSTRPAADHQFGSFQNPQVLKRCCPVEFREVGAQLARRQRRLLEDVQHPTTRRRREGLEDPVVAVIVRRLVSPSRHVIKLPHD
jgi:hypothetical protein